MPDREGMDPGGFFRGCRVDILALGGNIDADGPLDFFPVEIGLQAVVQLLPVQKTNQRPHPFAHEMHEPVQRCYYGENTGQVGPQRLLGP